jgi:hypothetical protein
MKLESYLLQTAISEGRYEAAVRLLLQHFDINLPGVQIVIKEAEDDSPAVRAWVGPDPYEWCAGSFYAFYAPAPGWPADRDYSKVEVVSATVWTSSDQRST